MAGHGYGEDGGVDLLISAQGPIPRRLAPVSGRSYTGTKNVSVAFSGNDSDDWLVGGRRRWCNYGNPGSMAVVVGLYINSTDNDATAACASGLEVDASSVLDTCDISPCWGSPWLALGRQAAAVAGRACRMCIAWSLRDAHRAPVVAPSKKKPRSDNLNNAELAIRMPAVPRPGGRGCSTACVPGVVVCSRLPVARCLDHADGCQSGCVHHRWAR